ncbi:NAD(P)-binding domain-containing protein [Catellatospora tritici]|uniref:NAD(P)-binding domain-containing protein n=1 Tax=Catellatospora tritici TaxID=2851566 RepID=UPI001C2DDEDA|nr:NAD(P)-binding domain-containing protein [Catellatospora tritici]MBV1855795.1 NAD(P)-binding domain-containing protein [Catellatospora tritici]
MSSITLIGTGNMARTIGTLAVAGGNTVEVMGRDQSKADDLAKALGGGATTGKRGAVPAGDIVITALLYDGVVPVVAEYGDALAGKVIVDISNPFNPTFDGLAHSEQTSIAQQVAKVAPASASVVKAFNTTAAARVRRHEQRWRFEPVPFGAEMHVERHDIAASSAAAGRRRSTERARPVDPVTGPLARATLLMFQAGVADLILAVHHLACPPASAQRWLTRLRLASTGGDDRRG